MAFTYGFYNSVEHDRVYTAEDLSSMFDGIISDGVFYTVSIDGSIHNNDHFFVSATGGMSISVGRGKAWFNHTWNTNNTAYPMVLDVANPIYPRYDAVVLEIHSNIEYRENSIRIIKGTAAQNPEKPVLKNIKGYYQHALAYIYVDSGVESIEQSDIENVVGTDETPYLRSISDDVALKIANNLTTPDDASGFALDARQGRVLNETKANKSDIVDNYGSSDPTKILSANMGRILNNKIVNVYKQFYQIYRSVVGDTADFKPGDTCSFTKQMTMTNNYYFPLCLISISGVYGTSSGGTLPLNFCLGENYITNATRGSGTLHLKVSNPTNFTFSGGIQLNIEVLWIRDPNTIS